MHKMSTSIIEKMNERFLLNFSSFISQIVKIDSSSGCGRI